MKALELRLLPPTVVLVFALTMWLTAYAFPGLSTPLPGNNVLAIFFALAGITSGAAGIIAFNRASTTFNPVRPHKAACIVSEGVFRFSRNPMYLGMLLLLAGWAAYLAHPLVFLFLPSFVAYMNRFQIIPEERALAEKFGAPFISYLNTVRRWI